jgi:hypothetical protein
MAQALVNALVRAWLAFADGVGAFIEEAAFRVALAFNVLLGRVPLRTESRRWWNRSVETPVSVDCFDWTTEKLVFTVLVWPPLEGDPHRASYDHRERVGTILEAIAQGAADRRWSVRWEIDGDLRWDNERQVWVGEDGFAYDGARLFDYSREGT